MREELQQFLNKTYSSKGSDISIPYTMLTAPVYIRFELGGILKNGTKKRARQVVNRISDIFSKAFQYDEQIWVLAYEYPDGHGLHGSNDDYFYKQFTTGQLETFYNSKELITTNYFADDENGNSTPEKIDVKIIVGKTNLKSVNIRNLLTASANLEMGLEPAISHDIYFISPSSGAGLHMYDDRGCDLWAPSADTLRHVYDKCNSWILDYNRKEIDAFFI